MSTTTASGRSLQNMAVAMPYMPSSQPTTYARPSDWLTLPTVSNTDQKFAGLLAVFNNDTNYVALLAITNSGTYTVDWGDGSSPQTYTSNTVASYKYTYSSISDSTISTRGYKQVIVTVTATTGNLTGINLQQKYVTSPVLALPPTNWLDIIVGSPNLTSLSISGGAGNTTNLPMLEQFTWMSRSTATPSQFFRNCWALQNVIIDGSITGITGTTFWFGQCFNLKSAPYFDTSSVTDMSGMFNLCSSLLYVPPYNTQNVTNMSTMFQGCSSLKTVPAFNTIKVTTLTNTFDGCRSLLHVPNYNFSNVTVMSATFLNCQSLISVPTFNTANLVNAYNTFGGCSALEEFPAWNMAKTTNTAAMFSGCSSLNSVANVNTSNVINMQTMFFNCSSLEEIPLIDTAKNQNAYAMFQNCYSLLSAPDFNTSNCANFSSMFQSCTSLQTAPSVNTYSSGNSSSMYSGCTALNGDVTITINGLCNVATLISSCNSIDTLTITGNGIPSPISGLATGTRSLRSINITSNLPAGVLGGPNAFASSNSLSSLRMVNNSVSFSIASCMFDKSSIETVFGDMLPNATSQTVTISSNPGADLITSTLSAGSSVGTTTLTVASTAGMAAGMYVTNSVAFADAAVTTTASTDLVTRTNHGLSNGTRICFITMTGTGLSLYTVYYVINATANTFQVSLTSGGSVVDITGGGSGTMRYEVQIANVLSGTQIQISAPTTAATTATALTVRKLNFFIATFKNWTVTG